MLSTKDVIEKFEVTRATLHNWKTTKPNLHNHLFNADEQFEKYRKTNILLDRYIKTTKTIKIFETLEIEYIYSLDIAIDEVDDIENLPLIYINTSGKIKKENDTFTLDIYKKLESLNLIQRYIFADRLKELKDKKESKKQKDEDWLSHYFKEFLK
ncbi:MAG: hypothetical protein U9Q33_09975 [Campylobacterota bacterium]|nr:hypothetical protein [Campylobacterota bacterium]